MFGTKEKQSTKAGVAGQKGSLVSQESFQELFEKSLKTLKEGDVVTGEISEIRPKEVLVDIHFKSEGVVSLDEFSNPESLKVGDKVDVMIETLEDDDGMVVLSKRKADRAKCWDQIIANSKEGSVVEGRIFKKVRGGFMVDIGMEAFLPASLVALKPTRNLDQFLGQTYKFKIATINQKRKNIVLSRKDFLYAERGEQRAKFLSTLSEGQVVKGKVKNITDFGAFIDLGGVDGLLHITDISWGRISHPSEVLQMGQELDLTIIGFDKDNQRISLGLKQLKDNPWEKIDDKYQVGTRIKGKVVNLVPYGAFIELETGIEGLIHISELSWTKRINHPSEILKVGDEVEAMILSVDKENRKIALGLKQTEENPWVKVEEKYQIGSTVEGQVRNITDYGLFVELEEGIDGLVHVSDLSWVKKVNPVEEFQKGQTIKAQVLTVDANAKRIALGVKQLEEDPWSNLIQDIPEGSAVEAIVTRLANFGVFVNLPNGLEGLLHVSEIDDAKAQELEKHFKAGDAIRATILKIDQEARRIALTQKSGGSSSSEDN